MPPADVEQLITHAFASLPPAADMLYLELCRQRCDDFWYSAVELQAGKVRLVKLSGPFSAAVLLTLKGMETVLAACSPIFQASVDARINQRKAEKDRRREAEALAKLEAMCTGTPASSRAEERESMKWGTVNPPSKASSDSDSEDEAAKRLRLRRQKKKEKEAAKAAEAAAAAAGANPGSKASGRPESTMERLRREAEEAKAAKEKEKQARLGTSAFDSSAARPSSPFMSDPISCSSPRSQNAADSTATQRYQRQVVLTDKRW